MFGCENLGICFAFFLKNLGLLMAVLLELHRQKRPPRFTPVREVG
jgi:hypothetical protein